jgi:hypothetical protein
MVDIHAAVLFEALHCENQYPRIQVRYLLALLVKIFFLTKIIRCVFL